MHARVEILVANQSWPSHSQRNVAHFFKKKCAVDGAYPSQNLAHKRLALRKKGVLNIIKKLNNAREFDGAQKAFWEVNVVLVLVALAYAFTQRLHASKVNAFKIVLG
mgnify:CR=1 FL=1